MGEILAHSMSRRKGVRACGRGARGPRIEAQALWDRVQKRMSLIQRTRKAPGGHLCELTDGGIGPGQGRFPQIEDLREALDPSPNESSRIRRLDLTGHVEGDLAHGTRNRQAVDNVAVPVLPA